MSLANPLIIGGILIAAGVILAIVAYLVLSGKPAEPTSGVPEEEEAVDQEAADMDDLPPTPPAAAGAEPEGSEEDPALAEAPAEGEVQPAPPEAASPPEAVSPGPKPRIRVATLLRDEVSGELIIEADGVEYTSPEALRASSHWTRVEYAATDLQKWLEKKQPPPSKPDLPVDAEAVEAKPESMVEQINAILQEQIAASERSDLAVRLIERPDGAVRVLIGVNSYELSEVPDAEVHELIRRSVSMWESKQT